MSNGSKLASACFYCRGNYPITKTSLRRQTGWLNLEPKNNKYSPRWNRLAEQQPLNNLIQACGIQDTAVMRNALTLQEKNFVAIRAKIQNIIKLTPEGEQYAKDGLPERKLILATAELGGTADLQTSRQKKQHLSTEFIQIALGWIIRKKWATYTSAKQHSSHHRSSSSPNNYS